MGRASSGSNIALVPRISSRVGTRVGTRICAWVYPRISSFVHTLMLFGGMRPSVRGVLGGD